MTGAWARGRRRPSWKTIGAGPAARHLGAGRLAGAEVSLSGHPRPRADFEWPDNNAAKPPRFLTHPLLKVRSIDLVVLSDQAMLPHDRHQRDRCLGLPINRPITVHRAADDSAQIHRRSKARLHQSPIKAQRHDFNLLGSCHAAGLCTLPIVYFSLRNYTPSRFAKSVSSYHPDHLDHHCRLANRNTSR